MVRLCWRGHKWKSESAEFKTFSKEVLGVSLYLLPLCHSDQQWFILTQTGSICEVCELLSVLYWLRFGFSQPVLYHAMKTWKIKRTAEFNDAIVALLIMKTSQKLWSRCCKRPWSNPGLFSVASAFFYTTEIKSFQGRRHFWSEEVPPSLSWSKKRSQAFVNCTQTWRWKVILSPSAGHIHPERRGLWHHHRRQKKSQ